VGTDYLDDRRASSGDVVLCGTCPAGSVSTGDEPCGQLLGRKVLQLLTLS
jgi:hypothetical protein